ncbi:MAG: helix-turn-helix transcriptional regulator [Bacteroidetes bacterium]|jgi:transcriptional regulator with XRE-family HTH domain|nr:helix-turn-helix transcriptional regulator [Bacteroidota bacterium]
MALHIGKIIRQHLEELGMTKSEFARRISTSPQNIYGIFKRKSIDTELLREISRTLNYDFFQYYSSSALVVHEDKAAYGKAQVMTAMELQRELDAAKKELEILRSENAYLKEIHKLLKERSDADPAVPAPAPSKKGK